MDPLFVLLLAIGLGMDACAVAMAIGVTLGRVNRRQTFRLVFHFGLFQALMPVIGWAAGRTVVDVIAAWDHWVAFGLLGFIGGRALWSAIAGNDEGPDGTTDPTRGLSLIVLSVATSIDALASGLSLAMLQVSIWTPVLVIGVTAGLMTYLGLLVGARVGLYLGRWMEAAGGLVLIGLGTYILLSQTVLA